MGKSEGNDMNKIRNVHKIASDLDYLFQRIYKNDAQYMRNGMIELLRAIIISLQDDLKNNCKIDDKYLKEKFCLCMTYYQ
jgi:hypothetical protein